MKIHSIIFGITLLCIVSQIAYAADNQQKSALLSSYTKARSAVKALVVMPRHIVAGYNSGNIRIWDHELQNERIVSDFNSIQALVSISRNEILACSGQANPQRQEHMSSIKRWDIESKKLKETVYLPHADKIKAIATSNSSAFIATKALFSQLERRELGSLSEISSEDNMGSNWVKSLAISPDNKTVAAGNISGKIFLYTNDKLSCTLNCNSEKEPTVKSLAFNRSGTQLLAGLNYEELEEGKGKVALFDVASNTLIKEVSDQKRLVTAVAFTPDDTLILSTGSYGQIKIRDVRTWEIITTLGDGSKINTLALTPDGNTIVAGHNHGVVNLWDLKTALNGNGANIKGDC